MYNVNDALKYFNPAKLTLIIRLSIKASFLHEAACPMLYKCRCIQSADWFPHVRMGSGILLSASSILPPLWGIRNRIFTETVPSQCRNVIPSLGAKDNKDIDMGPFQRSGTPALDTDGSVPAVQTEYGGCRGLSGGFWKVERRGDLSLSILWVWVGLSAPYPVFPRRGN